MMAAVLGVVLLIVAVPVLTIYLVKTMGRRARCRSRLRMLGWPRIWITPNLLVFPDAAWRRLPPFEEVAVTLASFGDARPRALLHETLNLLSPEGWQWARW